MKYYCLFLILLILLGGCGGTEYTYVDERNEKQGPGLFSGDDGVFTVVGKKDEEQEVEDKSAAE